MGTFIGIPDQVTSKAGSGTPVAAAALDKSHAKRRASLAAAAFVFFFCGAAAASCWKCVSGSAAARVVRIRWALLGRPLALLGLFFVLIWVNWKEVAISSAAAITFFCLGTAAAGFGRCGSAAAAALQYIFTLEDRHSVLVDLEHFNESDGEVGHNTASSLTEGIGDQASERVDVPGGVPQPAAALHERLGHSGETRNEFPVPG